MEPIYGKDMQGWYIGFGFRGPKHFSGTPYVMLPTALREAREYAAQHNAFIAPMPLLIKQFSLPRESTITYTANSEEHSGIDKHGKFGPKGDYVVVTLHGGKEGIGILTPEVMEKAYDMEKMKKRGIIRKIMRKKKESGVNELGSFILGNVFGRDIFTDLLHGVMPDGAEIRVMSYEQLIHDGPPGEFQRYAVVRPLNLARYNIPTHYYRIADKLRHQNQSIIDKFEASHRSIDELIDAQGRVTDSQVTVYAGGIQEAVDLIRRNREFKISDIIALGVFHQYDSPNFNPNEQQGDFLSLRQDPRGIIICNCHSDVGFPGFVVVMPAEAQGQKPVNAPDGNR